MGIASFVVGLLCLILSPFSSILFILPSILGLGLGILDILINNSKNKNKKKKKNIKNNNDKESKTDKSSKDSIGSDDYTVKVAKGISIAGIVLSTISLLLCIILTFAMYQIYGTVNSSFIDEFLYNKISSSLEGISDSNSNGNLDGNLSSSLDNITLNGTVGETVTLEDLKVTLLSIEKDFKDYYDYVKIDEDYMVIKVNFEFENMGKYNEYVLYSDFECFADKFSCDEFNSLEDSYFYERIEPGSKVKGSVYFEIPRDAENLEIEFSPMYTQKIIFTIPVLGTD